MRAPGQQRVRDLMGEERSRFARTHPRSRELFERAARNMLNGVPMPFMTEWPGGFPVFAAEARGAEVTDVDGHRYADLCLGDTGAMTGHAPAAIQAALTERFPRGASHMLPTEDAVWVAAELARRFRLGSWQFALSATDANRFALRLARQVTGRRKILVFNWCYHGTVDETIITVVDGRAGPREGNEGWAFDPALTTRVVEFNDLDALEAALAPEDVACVLAEPAMTNIGIIHPDPGFHSALRQITRATGTLLIMDETHTLCAGPGGCTAAWNLEPDFVVVGKPIASGLAAAAYGFSAEIADKLRADWDPEQSVTGGIGGTLAANALTMYLTKVTLDQVLTEDAYARMFELADRYADGVARAIAAFGVPWHITRLGCRAEYRFRPSPPRNGTESAAHEERDLMRLMHLYTLNRGVLLTPFHNMALMSPATTNEHVDRHTEVFRAALADLTRE
jgi:glutamate-1-semialdehyde 2,1-aminomutase